MTARTPTEAAIVDMLRAAPQGLTWPDFSEALDALVKRGVVRRETGADGQWARYRLVDHAAT